MSTRAVRTDIDHDHILCFIGSGFDTSKAPPGLNDRNSNSGFPKLRAVDGAALYSFLTGRPVWPIQTQYYDLMPEADCSPKRAQVIYERTVYRVGWAHKLRSRSLKWFDRVLFDLFDYGLNGLNGPLISHGLGSALH